MRLKEALGITADTARFSKFAQKKGPERKPKHLCSVRRGSGGRADGNGDTKRPRGAGEAWQGSPEKAGEARDEKCEQNWLAKAGLSPGSPQAPARRGVCEHAERSPGEGQAAHGPQLHTPQPSSQGGKM